MLAVVTKFLLIALFFYRCSADSDNCQFRPKYHLYPLQSGWMNDPNGFCKYQGVYHMFYQYNPYSSQVAGIANWGHATSIDLMHWKDQPIAMKPDQPYDITGVFSGSAIVENDTMHLLYTGNVNTPGSPAMQFQALATSTDGVNFEKYAGNPVIVAEEHQPNIRDPKVWKHGDLYYMVLGNSYNNDTLGRILLYVSKDLTSWKEVAVLLESDGSLGFMWECPDFFELGGYHVLLMSPQGMNPEGDSYRNLFQTGYIVGTFDYKTLLFKPLTKFIELDFGHDFYATQTMLDTKTKNKKGRRIVMAWFDMWEQYYPERDCGYTGQMTIPRELLLTEDLRLIQKPVEEISVARGHTLYCGKAQGGQIVQLEDNAAEIKITARKRKSFELFIESTNVSVSISYDSLKGQVTLDRGGEDGIRRTKWRPVGKFEWYILVDSSSIELLCGDGEVTMSSRYFPDGDVRLRLADDSQAENMTVSAMKLTVERLDSA